MMKNHDHQIKGELEHAELVKRIWPEFWREVDFAMLLSLDDIEGDPRDLGEKIQALWANELTEQRENQS